MIYLFIYDIIDSYNILIEGINWRKNKIIYLVCKK